MDGISLSLLASHRGVGTSDGYDIARRLTRSPSGRKGGGMASGYDWSEPSEKAGRSCGGIAGGYG